MPPRDLVVASEALPPEWLGALTGRPGLELRVGLPAADEVDTGRVVALLTTLNCRVDPSLLGRFERLRVVSNVAVGYDNINLGACAARGIAVGHTPGVLTHATADLTLALLLAAARNLKTAWHDAAEGRWGEWSPTGWLGADLRGATLGIVGLGQIGTAVAERARAFGLEIVHTSRSPRPELEASLPARRLPLPELLAAADFVSLHVPLSPDTRHLIDAGTLRGMKPTAYLVNTSRGGVVDQAALARALDEGWIAGAALDVTDPEPLPPDHVLYALDNCLVLPHIGSATRGTRRAMARLAVNNLLAALDDQPLPHPVPLPAAP